MLELKDGQEYYSHDLLDHDCQCWCGKKIVWEQREGEEPFMSEVWFYECECGVRWGFGPSPTVMVWIEDHRDEKRS